MQYGLDKIINRNFDINRMLRNLRNVQITYAENSFKIQGDEKSNRGWTKGVTYNIDRDTLFKNVLQEHTLEQQDLPKPQKVVIDFSSPNIAKPFHVGHLRSTIIGNFIANAFTYFNNKVTKINYLGDWGTQFGLLQYGLQAKNINISTLETNVLKSLYDVYVYANKLAVTDENVTIQSRKYFSDIEQGKAHLQDWRSIRKATVQELQAIYKRLGIKFDTFDWESDYNGEAIKSLINTLESKGIIKAGESGKKVISVNNKEVTVLKSDGSTLYLSRDIAALLDRYKRFEFDKMLYVVDNAQTDHFMTLFNIVERVNEKCSTACEHVKFGRIKGMSTRQGNVVFLNDILDEAKRKMQEKQLLSKNTRSAAMNEETCDILGTTAVIINDLKQKRLKDYVFDWDKALQSEGDSGIKLQYLHCRLWSLEKNSGASIPDICDPSYLPEEIVGNVVAELSKFTYVLHRSLEEYEACMLVKYLFRLSRHVNRMFNELKVKNVDPDLAAQRLLVFHKARIVIKTSLEVLGVKVLNEM